MNLDTRRWLMKCAGSCSPIRNASGKEVDNIKAVFIIYHKAGSQAVQKYIDYTTMIWVEHNGQIPAGKEFKP